MEEEIAGLGEWNNLYLADPVNPVQKLLIITKR
jgi:hypothetical protein